MFSLLQCPLYGCCCVIFGHPFPFFFSSHLFNIGVASPVCNVFIALLQWLVQLVALFLEVLQTGRWSLAERYNSLWGRSSIMHNLKPFLWDFGFTMNWSTPPNLSCCGQLSHLKWWAKINISSLKLFWHRIVVTVIRQVANTVCVQILLLTVLPYTCVWL